ncbi:MAG: sigma-54 dependent transcriptional regulator [Candidatus Ancaeobacter aquaticus]|nr:sigma-54 dependent transcriptional regulator [Candidatus Ancaeobacter aquaticus]
MAKRHILVVDDELGAQESFKMILKDDYLVTVADDGEMALDKLNKLNVHLVILDVIMPGMDGLEVLKQIRSVNMHIPVIMVTATKTIRTAVEAMRMGAFDYISKPFNVDEIRNVIKKAFQKDVVNTQGDSNCEQSKYVSAIVGNDKGINDVLRTVERVKDTDSNVLIIGESGTGKELVSRAVHYTGSRKDGPFIAVNSASITESLLESELFGHEKGSFTGAMATKKGTFELAHNGTLFLDEIIDTSLSLQAKLLRVLQEREFRRVGGTELIKVDVRFIAASNKDLMEAVREGKFREDLYYRVAVVPIEIPPLRERKSDIPKLIDHFFKQLSQKINSPVKMFSDEGVQCLMNYDWPGNVRELRNVIERVIVTVDSETIYPYHLSPQIRLHEVITEMEDSGRTEGFTLEGSVSTYERRIIEDALSRSNGVLSNAAEFLGTTRRILKYKVDKLGIDIRFKDNQDSLNDILPDKSSFQN